MPGRGRNGLVPAVTIGNRSADVRREITARHVLAILILAGCATTRTTPQQDYTYDMGRNCETPTTKLEQVDPDGRYWILARGVG